MADLVVKGGEDFYALSKALKAAGRTDLRKQLHKAMRDTAKPLVKAAKEAATDSGIPASGGLAAKIAKTPFRAAVSTGTTSAGVRVVAPGKSVTARMLNATGTFRHPVHADPSKTRKQWTWVTQSAPAAVGWFDRAMKAEAPAIQEELLEALDRVRREVLRSL